MDLTDDVGSRSDVALVVAAVRGRDEAFAEIYRRHAELAWRVARTSTLSDHEALMAVVDAFVALIDADVRGGASVRALLATLARDAALERMGRHHGAGPSLREVATVAPSVGRASPAATAPSGPVGPPADHDVDSLRSVLSGAVPPPPPELWALVRVGWNDRMVRPDP